MAQRGAVTCALPHPHVGDADAGAAAAVLGCLVITCSCGKIFQPDKRSIEIGLDNESLTDDIFSKSKAIASMVTINESTVELDKAKSF